MRPRQREGHASLIANVRDRVEKAYGVKLENEWSCGTREDMQRNAAAADSDAYARSWLRTTSRAICVVKSRSKFAARNRLKKLVVLPPPFPLDSHCRSRTHRRFLYRALRALFAASAAAQGRAN